MADLIPLGPFPDAAGYGPAVRLDETDALAEYRSRFVPAEPGLIYLDGNSLGRLPIASVAETERVVGVEWGERLIRSWRDRWWELAQTIGAMDQGERAPRPQHRQAEADPAREIDRRFGLG